MFTDFTNFFADAFGGRGAGHVHNGEDIAVSMVESKMEKRNEYVQSHSPVTLESSFFCLF